MPDAAFEPIAIVGMAAIMPDAPTAEEFWSNLKAGRYSVSDVPAGRWDPALYFDPDPRAPDKTYSRIGGWVREYPWDPIAWKLPVPPKVAEQMDGGQRWAVSAARMALLDAGWPGWNVDPERVAVILGNAIGGEKHYQSNLRIEVPEVLRELGAAPSFASLPEPTRSAVFDETRKAFYANFVDITEDTMPGELANVMAGRIANLFNFRGPNFTTDAACASGLAAVWSAAQGLASRQYDVAVTGGIDRNMGVAAFVKFCKIGALSATGTRPFDASADGFVMGEGAAVFVLKRLADAERDGNHIYALLLGIAGSSDGKGKGITAPNPAGQRVAIKRAWEQTGVDPASVSAIEAHGTSTRVGDAAELESLTSIFDPAGAQARSIALGSVKSNIGHLKAGAGAAGLFKMAKMLDEKLLVPSLNFAVPNPNVDWATSPFAVNTSLRDWPAPRQGVRVGGVSAFGFGGTNFHAVLEEYVPGRHHSEARAFAGVDLPQLSDNSPEPARATVSAPGRRGALVIGGPSDAAVQAQLETYATGSARPPLQPDPALADAAVRVAIAYADADDLASKAGKALKAFASGNAAMWRMLRAQGVFLGGGPAPKVAFLYPGQGSQYVDMLGDLLGVEPIVAATFDEADHVMTPLLGKPLSEYIFIDETDAAAVTNLERHLLQTEITQPAVLTADLALTRLLAAHGIRPDLVMGHSLGEYGALVAADSLDFSAALEAVSARGHEMASLRVEDRGAMAAVFGPLADIERVAAESEGYVVVANVNSLSQAVIGGATDAVEAAVAKCQAAGMDAQRIPVSHAFHTSIVAPASAPLQAVLRRLHVRPPALPVVANVTGKFYPADADAPAVIDMLGRQVASPVQFVQGLRTLYEAGARVFVEVGPKRALHGFVEDVLGSSHDDVLALFTNHPKIGGDASFNQALCGLYAAGLGLRPATEQVATVRTVRAAPIEQLPPLEQQQQTPASEKVVAATSPSATSDSEPRTTVDSNTYLELGRIFADFLDRGRAVYAGSPAPAHADGGSAGEPVVITGAALGLPGVERVFDDDNIARILEGQQFIDAIPHRFRQEMVDKHITRLVKPESGDPVFVTIDSEADVVKLAGRRAPLDVVAEFGVEESRDAALDTTTRLAIGAGFDALRDAGIPLVMHYRTTTLGTKLPDRWGLPEQLRDDTGIVFASAFPGYTEFAHDLEAYTTDRCRRRELATLEAMHARVEPDTQAAADLEHRLTELRHVLETEPFAFDRRFIFRALAMGHSQFAELIGARGPNTQVNAACASTTQAICIAEDWIRTGRAKRVVIIAADDATSDELLPWVGSGFLASGAAATDDVVADAAIPFDRRRHGMIVGMGAAAFVVEAAEEARRRGIQPICELVGAVTANSAFHGTRLDVAHVGKIMEQVVTQAEHRGHDRDKIAANMVFVSHETYTPARGGSAAAEITALRTVFGTSAEKIVIANTKGFTGHAMGAGIEDVVAVKTLETGIVPPVPNYRVPDPDLGSLNLSTGGSYAVDYALRLAAGFGSQIAMTVLRWTPMPDRRRFDPHALGFRNRIVDDAIWHHWLAEVTGRVAPVLEVVQHRLRVAETGKAVSAAEDTSAPALIAQPAPEPAAEQPQQPPAAPVGSIDTGQPAEIGQPEDTGQPADAEPESTVDPVVDAVVGIVAEMTGYPRELLDLDLDLEADLGVDTVKQAEVFAAVRGKFGVERDENLKLRDFPTLNHVIGWVQGKLHASELTEAGSGGTSNSESDESPTTAEDTADPFPRRVPVPVLRPSVDTFGPTGVTLAAGQRVIVMSDDGGIGARLMTQLHARHVDTLVLTPAFTATELDQALATWRDEGGVDGIFWLAALDDEGPLDKLNLPEWREALRRRVKSLYATVRASYDAAPFLVAATHLGGCLGYDDAGATAPLGGAVSGFTKAYKQEQPGALVKVVDFPLDMDPDTVVRQLIAETEHDPGCVEVGHALDGTRWTIALHEKPFPQAGLALGPETVFAVTGAAGSIVSAITADLASSGGTFHLLDLTPPPDPDDPDLVRFRTDKDGLKLDIAARLAAARKRATPVAIERELARFERLAAAQAAVDAISAAGGTAHYHQVDLTQPDEVAAVIETIRQTSGRIDVLVHAAGLEISKSLPDKQPREYDLVFDVKSDGWFNLLHAGADVPIGATVVFSSVAGRFGNAGQTDYAAANDLLCKISSSFRRTHPQTRALAVDWTAWAGIGMATRGSIPRLMELAGIEMLDPQIGVPWIRHELTSGGSGEVVVAGALGTMAAEPTAVQLAIAAAGPMVGTVTVHPSELEITTTLDPHEQPFLNDHRIDGTAVLPGVMGIEAFGEAAGLLAPGWQLSAMENVDFLAPVKFYRDEPRTVTVHATGRRVGTDLVVDCSLSAERSLPGSAAPQVTTHFTGSVRLTDTPAVEEQAPPPIEPDTTVGKEPVYQLYFHGPAYQVVHRTWQDESGSNARLAAALPANHSGEQSTVANPRLIELCFQTAGLWEAAQHGRLALPNHVDEIRFFAAAPDGVIYAFAHPDGDQFDCAVRRADGTSLIRILGYRTVALPTPVPDSVRHALAPAEVVPV